MIRPILGTRTASILDAVMDVIDAGIRWIVFATPEAGLYFVRYAYPGPLDKLFFESMRNLALEIALPGRKARFVMRFARSLDRRVGGDASSEDGGSPSRKERIAQSVSRVTEGVKDSVSMLKSSEGWNTLAHLATDTDGEGLRGLATSGEEAKLQQSPPSAPDSSPQRTTSPTRPLPPYHHRHGRGTYLSRLTAYIRRYSRRLALLALISLLSRIPLLGHLIWPAATYLYLGLAIGYKRALYTCAVGLISPPWWRFVKGPLIRSIVSFRALERELVEPYLCRSVLDSRGRRDWFHRNEPLLAGFTVGFWVLLRVPWVGPVVFGVAQAAVARVVMEIFDEADVMMGAIFAVGRLDIVVFAQHFCICI